MSRGVVILLLPLIVQSGCSGGQGANGIANEATTSEQVNGTQNQAGGERSGSCTEPLQVEVAEPFGAPDTSSGGDREALRTDAEALFRRVAGRMCAAGEISSAAVGAYQELQIEYGGGADNSAFYQDVGRFGRDTLIFQYAFEVGGGGRFMLPDESDVREGLLCHFAAEAHPAMCNQRLP
ncbi:MAG: hypothetical protein ACXW2T_07330 [Allosphingosinicella sp.]